MGYTTGVKLPAGQGLFLFSIAVSRLTLGPFSLLSRLVNSHVMKCTPLVQEFLIGAVQQVDFLDTPCSQHLSKRNFFTDRGFEVFMSNFQVMVFYCNTT
jgi:hypothetical protein